MLSEITQTVFFLSCAMWDLESYVEHLVDFEKYIKVTPSSYLRLGDMMDLSAAQKQNTGIFLSNFISGTGKG